MNTIGTYLGSFGSRIFLFNIDVEPHGFGVNFGISRDFNELFDNDIETLSSIKYSFVVSELDKAVTMSEVLEANGGRDINGAAQEDNRLFQEWMAPHNSRDLLSALLVKTPRRFGGIGMMRLPELPAFGALEKERVRRLAPHIRRALAISDMMGDLTVERDRFVEIIEALATPIAVTAADGRVLHANRAARQLMSAGQVVRAEHNILRATDRDARAALDAVLKTGEDKIASAISLPPSAREGENAFSGMIASVLPIGEQRGFRDRASAIFFHAKDAPVSLPGEAFAKLHKLTGAELHVLTRLMEGLSVQEIARRGRKSPDTTRWHVKNLLAKTGCARQSDLMRLAMSALSPLGAPDSLRAR